MLVKFNRNPLVKWDRLLGEAFNAPLWSTDIASYGFKVDVSEDEQSMHIDADLAGVKKEDVDVSLEDSVLMIKAERKEDKEVSEKDYYRKERVFGSLSRTFSLGDDINPDTVNAEFKDGVLRITVDKLKNEKRLKRVEVK